MAAIMWQVSPTFSRNGVIFQYWKIFEQGWHCIFLVQQSKEVQIFLLGCWTLWNSHPATQHPDNICQTRTERERAVTLCPHSSISHSRHKNCFANPAILPLPCSINYYTPVSSPQRGAWLCQPLLTACSTTKCLTQTPDMASQMQMALSTLSQ
jgi:hypothetical protein